MPPKGKTAGEEYTLSQELDALDRVFKALDKKGDGKVRITAP